MRLAAVPLVSLLSFTEIDDRNVRNELEWVTW